MSIGPAFDVKEQIKRAIDIVDLVGEYLPLRREGRAYKGLCPWHDDSRPSLQVNPDRQTFRCYVCNIGGDIFSFIEKRESVSFREALVMLAERAGVTLPGAGRGPAGEGDQRRLMFEAMLWAEQQYHECLLRAPEAEPARRYLQSRGIAQESLAKFHLGFAPNEWDWLLKRARGTRFSPAVLQSVGLARPRQQGKGSYDLFRGRVLFSIRDLQGRPVALGGRIVPGVGDGEASKYFNTPETPLFAKSQLLYGLDLAKDAVSRSRVAIVMEGYTDCLIAQQAGIANAVAVLGTALGERHIHLLRRFADSVLLVLDGDEAGRRRADEILGLFIAAQMDVRILTLPDELDPADFLLSRGKEAFEELLAGAVDALDHKLRVATSGLDSTSGLDRIHRSQEEVLQTLAKGPRPTDSAACLREDQVLSRLAHRFRGSEASLRERLTKLREKSRRAPAGRPAPGKLAVGPAGRAARGAEMAGREPAPETPDKPERVEKPEKIDKAEQWLLEIVLAVPSLASRVAQEHPPADWHCPRRRALLSACCRMLDEGREPSVERLLLEIDDAQLKTLIVESDELNQRRQRPDPAGDVERLLAAIREYQAEQRRLAARVALGSANETEEEQCDELRRIIEEGRRRQGISAPMDG
jgi:DNA primase